MAKKINSGIIKIWASRTKDDLTWLNMFMLVYLTIQSGFVVKWWHVLLFLIFLIVRTVWDHKKVIPQQIDFWLGQSKMLKQIQEDIKSIKGKA